jgi:hypothetical protein
MCHFLSANYEDLVLKNEQTDWVVVAKRKQNSQQTKMLVTIKQDGKLKPPTYKLKPPQKYAKETDER